MIIEVMDPVHGVLDLLGLRTGRREHDQRFGVELPAKSQELLCPEPVIVRVAAPDMLGWYPRDAYRPMPSFHLYVEAKEPPGQRMKGGAEIAEGLQQVGAQHAVVTDIRAHHAR